MSIFEKDLLLGLAAALFSNHLHILRLTEIVRYRIAPNHQDGMLEVPEHLDRQLQQQAMDFVVQSFPDRFHEQITQLCHQMINGS